MTCAQLRTKIRTSTSRKICYVKSGLQIIYATEQLSSLFSKDKLEPSVKSPEYANNRVKKLVIYYNVTATLCKSFCEVITRVSKVFHPAR